MKQNNNSVKITLIIAATILVIALLGFYLFQQSLPEKTVTSNGMASIKVDPDMVSVYFSAETNADSAAEAKDMNAEIVDELITSLVKQGFDRSDIVTENFNVYPEYDWVDGERIEKGYRATHSIKVKMPEEKFDDVGEVIDAGVDAGALVSYINFELSRELQNSIKARALEQATTDARTKAEAIASGLGKNLGDIESVHTTDFNYYPWRAYSASGMEDAAVVKEAVTSIQPGEQEVSASVSVVYSIR